MQQSLYSIIFGIIQGITEFLPVSSSAHLLIFHQILNIEFDSLIFDVALHLGTLLALLIYFRVKLFTYLRNSLDNKINKDSKFLLAILFTTLPAGIAGYFFEDIIDLYLRNIFVVSITLILLGILLIIADKKSQAKYNLENFGFVKIFIIGIAQTLALIPGVSRSGITITSGLFLNLDKKSSAELSFLLAIPIILGASLKKIGDINFVSLSSTEIQTLVFGILSSFTSGYFVIKYFIKFLEKNSLAVFGWYRIVLGLTLLVWLIFFK
jgi:undecaprenyl-diphosphatase